MKDIDPVAARLLDNAIADRDVMTEIAHDQSRVPGLGGVTVVDLNVPVAIVAGVVMPVEGNPVPAAKDPAVRDRDVLADADADAVVDEVLHPAVVNGDVDRTVEVDALAGVKLPVVVGGVVADRQAFDADVLKLPDVLIAG